jgi:hypothetical protein
MSRWFAPLALAFAVLQPWSAAAGTVLKWQETTRLDGRPAHRAVIAYSSELGLRIQMLEIGSNIANSILLWVPATRTLHFKDGDKAWQTISPEALERLQTNARGGRKTPSRPPVTVRTTGSRHTVNGFPCEAYSLQQKGRTTRLVCLADPVATGIDEVTRRNFREMSHTMIAFIEATSDPGSPAEAEEGIRYNTYDMPGGFPVRVWETRVGETWIDSEMVNVAPGETPASLFEVPPPVSPTPTKAPSFNPGVAQPTTRPAPGA